MQFAPAGDRGTLVTFDSIDAAQLHARAAAMRRLPHVVTCVAGHSSLLVISEEGFGVGAIQAALGSGVPIEETARPRTHAIRVSFHPDPAIDLQEFLEQKSVTLDAFLARVSALRLTARFLGFRAGFAYLDGWPGEWAMPRRATHRAQVAAGSLAIAGAVAGFYPLDSPGGWNILGRTDVPFWDPNAEPPNRIVARDVIIIEPTLSPLPPITRTPIVLSEPPGGAVAEVLSAGQLTMIVSGADWRRVEAGLPPGGPFDERAAALANRAVGNEPNAPILECAMIGPTLQLLDEATCSWFGATAEITVDGVTVDHPQSFPVRRGQRLAIGRLRHGLRGYLAIDGEFHDPHGPYAETPFLVTKGSVIGRRARQTSAPAVLRRATQEEVGTVVAIAGPHFVPLPDVIDCRVTPQMNRTGVRLQPVVSLPGGRADLRSCGMQKGTIQLHPDGSLVAMGPDHPITGGYLQPLTVVSSDVWKLGQWAPGDSVRIVVQKR